MINVKIEGIKETKALFSPEIWTKATNHALNKAGSKTKTEIAKKIREEYTIKDKAVKKRIDIEKSSPKNLRFIIKFSDKRVPLVDFAGFKKSAKGYRGRIKNTEPRKEYKRTFKAKNTLFTRIPGTQMERSKYLRYSQKLGRLWKREKIKPLYGPSVAAMVTDKVEKAAKEIFQNEFTKNFMHDLEFYKKKRRR